MPKKKPKRVVLTEEQISSLCTYLCGTMESFDHGMELCVPGVNPDDLHDKTQRD